MNKNYVMSLDLGTTTIRAFIYDQNGSIKGNDMDKVCNLVSFYNFIKNY